MVLELKEGYGEASPGLYWLDDDLPWSEGESGLSGGSWSVNVSVSRLSVLQALLVWGCAALLIRVTVVAIGVETAVGKAWMNIVVTAVHTDCMAVNGHGRNPGASRDIELLVERRVAERVVLRTHVDLLRTVEAVVVALEGI